MENIVAIYLHSLYGEQLYYIKSAKTGIDVDFYIPEENLAIQVAYSLDADARAREINNLSKLAKANPGMRLMILTHSEEELVEVEGNEIEVIPCAKYLVYSKCEKKIAKK